MIQISILTLIKDLTSDYYFKYLCAAGLVIIMVGLSHHTSCQTIKVLDASDETQLKYVSVYNADLNYFKESDDKGNVDVSDFELEMQLCVSLLGYEEQCFVLQTRGDLIILLVREDIFMEAITIRGSKTNQNTYNLPAHIESMKISRLLSKAPQTSADIVGNANGVFVQKSQQGGGSPIIRGFAANRILLVLDGIRLNNAIYRSGNLQNIISINPNSLEKVDVLLGPNSLIYGSDALGGVIHMHSDRGGLNQKARGNLLARYNSTNNELTYSMGAKGGTDNIYWSSQFSFSRFGDLRMGGQGRTEYLRDSFQIPGIGTSRQIDRVIANPNLKIQKESGFNQFFTEQHIGLKIDPHSSIDYSLYYSKTSDIPRYDRLTELSGSNFRNAVWNYGPQEWFMNRAAYRSKANKWHSDELSVMLAYQTYQESRHDRKLHSENLRNRTENVKMLSANIDATKNGHNTSTSYGLEWLYNLVNSEATQENVFTKSLTPVQSRYPNNSKWSSFASYIQKSMAINKWHLSGGLRYTFVSTRAPISNEFLDLPFTSIALDNHAVSGSVGVNVVPTKNLFLYSNISTGFRAPNIDDVGKVFDSEPGAVVVPNDQLTPEYIYGIELGIQNRKTATVNYHLGGFYTHIEDIISRVPFSFNGLDSIIYDGELSQIQALQNADKGYIWGLEAKVDYSFGNKNVIAVSINYQNGKEKTSEGTFPLRHITPVFGHFSFSKHLDKWSFETTCNANGSITFENLANTERAKPHIYARNDLGNPFSPSWWTLDGSVQFRPLQNLSIVGGVQNIFDKRYRTYSSAIAAPGRGVNISIIYGFD